MVKLDLKEKCVLGFEFPRDDRSSDLGLTKVNSLKCFSWFQKKSGIFETVKCDYKDFSHIIIPNVEMDLFKLDNISIFDQFIAFFSPVEYTIQVH